MREGEPDFCIPTTIEAACAMSSSLIIKLRRVCLPINYDIAFSCLYYSPSPPSPSKSSGVVACRRRRL